MSLNWDTTACSDAYRTAIGYGRADYKDCTHEEQVQRAKTEAITWSALVTGLGKKWNIEAGDVDEIFLRMSAYEHAIDSPVRFVEPSKTIGKDDVVVACWLTRADIELRIGLRVNVTPVTRAKFERTLGTILMRAAEGRK